MKPLLNSFTIDLVEKESKSIRKQLVARCAVHDCFGGLQTYARCEFECGCKVSIDEALTEFISAIAATETTAVVLTACMNNVKEFVAMFS